MTSQIFLSSRSRFLQSGILTGCVLKVQISTFSLFKAMQVFFYHTPHISFQLHPPSAVQFLSHFHIFSCYSSTPLVIPKSVLLLNCQHNKFSQTQWLEATQIYYLTVSIGQVSGHSLVLCFRTQVLAGLCSFLEALEMKCFRTQFGCWPNSVPCGCRTEVPVSLLTCLEVVPSFQRLCSFLGLQFPFYLQRTNGR